ncbi:MAG: Rab family GTPase [Candidatus Hodarchaeales archaeon]|jgi:small GTP-binding protein
MDFFSKFKEKLEKRKRKEEKKDDYEVLTDIFSKNEENNINKQTSDPTETVDSKSQTFTNETKIRMDQAQTTEEKPENTFLDDFRSNKHLEDYSEFIHYISQKSRIITDNQMLQSKWSSSHPKQNQKLTPYSSLIGNESSTVGPTVPVTPNIKISTPEYLFVKICLLGDGAVGKTALRRAYLGEGFKSEYLMTIGADFSLTTVEIDNIQIKFQIWDLAGQPRFNLVRNTYYTGSYGALIIYDRTRPESFNSCLNWLSELWKGSGRGPVPFVLLGNKSDLIIDSQPTITDNQAYNLMETFNHETVPRKGFEVSYYQTSAKSHQNVDEAFYFLGSQVLSWIRTIRAKKSLKI